MTTPRFNQVLESIRRDLEEQSEVWGPDTVKDEPDTGFQSGAAGPGGATNYSDAADAFDEFIVNVARTVENECGMSLDQATDFVFDAAGELEDNGLLPAMPGDGADAGEIARWLGTAGTIGFGAQVLRAARSEMSGSTASDDGSDGDDAGDGADAAA